MATTVARYPYELSLNKDTHYVQFEFLEFKSGGFATNTALGAAGSGISSYSGEDYEKNFQQVKNLPANKILMYMPDDQGTQISASWGGKSFTFLGTQALRAAAQTTQATDQGGLLNGAMGAAGGIYDAFRNAFQTGGKASSALAAGASSLLGLIPGVANNLSQNDILQAGTSQILNPNVEMFYEGPQMRTLTMKFSMSARTPGEAQQIESIVKAFRMAAAPSYVGSQNGKGSRFIKIPSYVKMRYMVGGSDNNFLPKHKLMTLMSVDVRYDNGMYQVFSDDRPLYTELSIALQESKIIFREDIDNGF